MQLPQLVWRNTVTHYQQIGSRLWEPSLEHAIRYLNTLHEHIDEAFESVRSTLV